MTRYVAFLRGINLGRRRVKMEQLRSRFEELGFSAVSTFIASGNVLFETPRDDEDSLTTVIEHHLKKVLGYEVDAFLRTRDEVASIAATPPFGADGGGHSVHVVFLRERLGAAVSHKLISCKTGVDDFHVRGRELYWRCQVRITESTVWNSPGIKALSLPSMTMRNMTTIQKLAGLFK